MVKGVKSYLFNIILIIIVLLISIPLWFNDDNKKAYSLASSFDDINIYLTISNHSYKTINNFLVKDINVVIRNQNSFNKDYKTIIKLENKDNIEYKDIILKVNDKTDYLVNYQYSIVDNYYLIEIDNNTLEGYTNKYYNVEFIYDNYLVSNLYTEFLIR